jgi:hypothetical protein
MTHDRMGLLTETNWRYSELGLQRQLRLGSY